MAEQYMRKTEEIKRALTSEFANELDEVLSLAKQGATQRAVEQSVWKQMVKVGQRTLGYGFALLCQRATEEDLQRRGLSLQQVSLRLGQDEWPTVMTTLGPVTFPWFAYREDAAAGGTRTVAPARERVFPQHRHCRSSALCLEWESSLGSDHPFRKAEDALSFFSHGAVQLEDTTIARHMVDVGSMVERDWLFASVDQMKQVLSQRATCDRRTGRPLLYLSTDAHALRRYVDETWDASWKMANGLRLWCVDRHHGGIIHLGGEYTWGDCQRVTDIVQWLIASGRVPADGDYGDGLVAQLILVTDGAEWIQTRIAPLFVGLVRILDAYHVLERLAEYAALLYGKGSPEAKAWYAQAVKKMFGGQTRPKRARARQRRGHHKRPRVELRDPQLPAKTPVVTEHAPARAPAAEDLLYFIEKQRIPAQHSEARANLLGFIDSNAPRMDYQRYLALGYQIGSGAMESLHRTASQIRLKIPGGRWLDTTSQAILNLRMLMLSGRWDEFWSQPDLMTQLAAAIEARKKRDSSTGPAQADETAHEEAA